MTLGHLLACYGLMWWTHLPALDDDLDTLDEVMESLEVGI